MPTIYVRTALIVLAQQSQAVAPSLGRQKLGSFGRHFTRIRSLFDLIPEPTCRPSVRSICTT